MEIQAILIAIGRLATVRRAASWIDRVVARLRCRAPDGHASRLIYDIVRVFDWARCVLMSMLFDWTGWLLSAAELNSLGIQIKPRSLLPLFRHVLPLLSSFFGSPSLSSSNFSSALLAFLLLRTDEFHYSACPSRNVSAHTSLHYLCMFAYNAWSLSWRTRSCAAHARLATIEAYGSHLFGRRLVFAEYLLIDISYTINNRHRYIYIAI